MVALLLAAPSLTGCAHRAAAPALEAPESGAPPPPSETTALAAIARERPAGCVERAVRASCGEESVGRLYLLRDRMVDAEAGLAVERLRREEDAAAADRALALERAVGQERKATCRRELAECRALDRPAGPPWWAWPAAILGGAAAGAVAWEAVR